MTAIVLSSNEKDLTKIIFAINQIAQGRSNAVWTSFSPTLTPNVGSITPGGTSSYLQMGQFVLVSFAPTVAAISGGPASVTISIPLAPKKSLTLLGTEEGTTGKVIASKFNAGATTSLTLRDYTGTVWVPALNDKYVLSGVYET